ncbi:MAG: CRISPR-associated endonuclease Cas2 [Fischerella sp. CENA71]|nr:CRISPR-associated endonuclease Cas2 [Fischerella sp. CENA71]
MIAQEKVTPNLIEAMKQELDALKNSQDSILIYPFQQMRAIK